MNTNPVRSGAHYADRTRSAVARGGEREPSHDNVCQMHDEADEICFIANLVKTEIFVEL